MLLLLQFNFTGKTRVLCITVKEIFAGLAIHREGDQEEQRGAETNLGAHPAGGITASIPPTILILSPGHSWPRTRLLARLCSSKCLMRDAPKTSTELTLGPGKEQYFARIRGQPFKR